MVSFHYSNNICIHLTFPNVPSHLLGRRHGPLHLITYHIPQCTLTFTWEKTVSPFNYQNIYSSHIPKCTFKFTWENTWPSPIISQFYIHVTFPNLLLTLPRRREVNYKDGWEVNDINERWLRWRREGGYKKGRRNW